MIRSPILLLALTACSPKTTDTSGNDTATTDTCPRDGTVPASARDVERDAEGIASTAFGTHPEHVADFDRVGMRGAVAGCTSISVSTSRTYTESLSSRLGTNRLSLA